MSVKKPLSFAICVDGSGGSKAALSQLTLDMLSEKDSVEAVSVMDSQKDCLPLEFLPPAILAETKREVEKVVPLERFCLKFVHAKDQPTWKTLLERIREKRTDFVVVGVTGRKGATPKEDPLSVDTPPPGVEPQRGDKIGSNVWALALRLEVPLVVVKERKAREGRGLGFLVVFDGAKELISAVKDLASGETDRVEGLALYREKEELELLEKRWKIERAKGTLNALDTKEKGLEESVLAYLSKERLPEEGVIDYLVVGVKGWGVEGLETQEDDKEGAEVLPKLDVKLLVELVKQGLVLVPQKKKKN